MSTFIGIGQIGIGDKSDSLRTFVGSCVAVVLHNPVGQVAVLAHVQLPAVIAGPSFELGRYADTAVPELLRQLQARSRQPIEPVAHIAGGADMFPVVQSRSVGRLNSMAVKRLLVARNIPILTESCGGTLARRLVFDVKSGCLKVELIAPPPIVMRPDGGKR